VVHPFHAPENPGSTAHAGRGRIHCGAGSGWRDRRGDSAPGGRGWGDRPRGRHQCLWPSRWARSRPGGAAELTPVRIGVLMLGVLLLLLLQAVELWRRLRDPAALTPGQFWRRIVTAAVLQLVLLMWLAGEALVRRQPPLTQMAYWTAALLFGIAAAFSAM